MKKIINIICCLLIFIFVGSGCKKILEPKIYSQVNASDFPQSEADVLSAFIPFYAQFNPNYGSTDVSNGVFDFSSTTLPDRKILWFCDFAETKRTIKMLLQ